MAERTWIEEQKEIQGMFNPAGGGDAERMLEISDTNRYMFVKGAKLIVAGRFMAKQMGLRCLNEICDLTEKAQLITDGRSRADFMKVAIEQWQGKLANSGRNKLEVIAGK